jgi:hypothetical protein
MDIEDLLDRLDNHNNESCYMQRLAGLKSRGRDTTLIEKGMSDTIQTLESGAKSFVIYGEPQSGKTEFMIALVCKLIDMGKKTIFIVMNDNTELENQNFDRFHAASELNPTPMRDYELAAHSPRDLQIKRQRIIFCRKNSKNLQKLIELVRWMDDRVIIDDEADYASPNARINKDEVTAINKFVAELGRFNTTNPGIYIGVTATPARLDLNNTFANDASKWVFLESHDQYKGHNFFFPLTKKDIEGSNYNLVRLPDETDDPKLLRTAVFRFMLRVALLNLHPSSEVTPYSMLIHTAGKTNDHETDQNQINTILSVLADKENSKFKQYAKELFKVSQLIVNNSQVDFTPEEIWTFVMKNIGKKDVLVINHKNDSGNVKRAGQPKALFTFAIGGNIVSRGLTFENLLSFYFSRNVKNKLQQNTYIQRARMFGWRPYSKHFELCVPETLFKNWAECFHDHEVSLRLAKAGEYLHVYGDKTQVVDAAAIDKNNVTSQNSERAVGELFELTERLEAALIEHDQKDPLAYLEKLISDGVLPESSIAPALRMYLKEINSEEKSQFMIVLRSEDGQKKLQSIENYSDGDSQTIQRPRGGIIHAMLNKRHEYERYQHFILPIKNSEGYARIIYKPKLKKSIMQNIKIQRAITI